MILSTFGTGLAFKVFPKIHSKSENIAYNKKVVSVFHPDVTDGTGHKDNVNNRCCSHIRNRPDTDVDFPSVVIQRLNIELEA